jgi:hypothetical protein
MITGTFLDETSHEIPSANWGPEEWARDFAAMKADGIDTVILNRAGFADRATFDSAVLRRRHPHLLVQEDLVGMFLGLAEQKDIGLWFGTYDSGECWSSGRHAEEADISRALADEVWERYGRSRAFRGWYVGQAIDVLDPNQVRACEALTLHLRQLSALPVVVAPALRASLSKPERAKAFSHLAGMCDIVVLREGDDPSRDLPDRISASVELARSHRLVCWSDAESFERGTQSFPIAWPKLRFKMEAAVAARVDKLITFEYSHFMSPHSMFSSAHMLHRRYREWLATQK